MKIVVNDLISQVFHTLRNVLRIVKIGYNSISIFQNAENQVTMEILMLML